MADAKPSPPGGPTEPAAFRHYLSPAWNINCASPPRHRAWPRAGSRSSGHGCQQLDTDRSGGPSPSRRSHPPARSRCSCAGGADPLLQFGRISLDPAKDGGVIHLHAAVHQHHREIAVADGEHQIPSDRPQDHLAGKLPTFESLIPSYLWCSSPSRRATASTRLDRQHKDATEPYRWMRAMATTCRSSSTCSACRMRPTGARDQSRTAPEASGLRGEARAA